jgi:hypothetical protein
MGSDDVMIFLKKEGCVAGEGSRGRLACPLLGCSQFFVFGPSIFLLTIKVSSRILSSGLVSNYLLKPSTEGVGIHLYQLRFSGAG